MDPLLLCKIVLILGLLSGAFITIMNFARRWNYGLLAGLPLGWIAGDVARFTGWIPVIIYLSLVFAVAGWLAYRAHKLEKQRAKEMLDNLDEEHKDLLKAFKRYP